MGLDMYFTVRKSSYKAFHSFEAEKGIEDKTEYPENLNAFKDYILNRSFRCTETKVDYLIGYFRNFNALHRYIVEHYGNGIDECQEIILFKDNVEYILKTLKKVSADHTKAQILLPTRYSVDTDYDEWYFENIEEAIKLFEMILNNFDFDKYDLIYQASW